MPRLIQDAILKATTALGNNNSTVNSNALDLGQVTAFPINETIGVQIVTTAGNGANNKNINIRVQHSNVNTSANFTNITELGVLVIPEVSASYAASTLNVSLPPGTKQFIRAQAITENAGGNANNGNVTIKVLF